MIIQTRGDWKKRPLADSAIQLSTIASKADKYKTLLDIAPADIQRILLADKMNKYINNARSEVNSWSKGLTEYDDQLLHGNMLQTMNDFPALPDLGTAPAAPMAGIWHFIENRRSVWMNHPKYTDAIGDEMTILGPIQTFDTDTYKPKLSAKVGAGVIHITTDSTIINVHNLSAAISGKPFVLITSFKGAKYEYLRTLATAGQAESVDLQVQGVYQNKPIGKLSDIVTVAYNG